MWICIPPSSLALMCNAVQCNNFDAQCNTMHCNRTQDPRRTSTTQQSTRILGQLGRCNPMFFLQPAVPCTQLRTSRCQYIPHTHLASIRPTALSSSHFFPPTRCNMVMGHPHAAKTARSTNTERADAFDRQYLAETFLQCDPSV